MVDLNSDTFDKEVKSEQSTPVLVMFKGAFCPHCRKLEPTVEQIAAKYESKLKVCGLDITLAPAIAAEYGIMGVPALLLFDKGELKESMIGGGDESKIVEKLGLASL